MNRTRRIIAIYFLSIAVPCGLFALLGDLMFGQGIWEEIVNWNRRSHSQWFFQNYAFFVLYLLLMNSGFALLFGYARFLRPEIQTTRNWENKFWLGSLVYNIIIAALNGHYIHGTAPLTKFTNPFDIAFWMVCVPFVGATLSAICLIQRPVAR